MKRRQRAAELERRVAALEQGERCLTDTLVDLVSVVRSLVRDQTDFRGTRDDDVPHWPMLVQPPRTLLVPPSRPTLDDAA